MSINEFIGKFKNRYIWVNVAGMVGVIILLVILLKVGMSLYTRHGQSVTVPNVVNMSIVDARHVLEKAGLNVEVTDTGYQKQLPADCILEQIPVNGSVVKPGHVVSLIINASSSPTLALPDIIDNCSLREAEARLRAMGFKVGPTMYVEGEKDWVVGVNVDGRSVVAGQKIPVEKTLIVLAGKGTLTYEDSLYYGDNPILDEDEVDAFSEMVTDEDPFEEIP